MQERFDILFEQYKIKALTGIKLDEFYSLIESGVYDQDIIDYADEIYLAIDARESFDPLPAGADVRILNNVFSTHGVSRSISVIKPQNPIYNFRMLAAAVAIMILSFATWFVLVPRHSTGKSELLSVQDVGPGKNEATLILSDGRKIALSDGMNQKIAVDAGFQISRDKGGILLYKISGYVLSKHAVNKLATARGQTYAVVLPDGTKVWLNSESKLEFSPALNTMEQRLVNLSGEGYFEVAKNKARPFVVQTSKQKVVVLGTHFNISAYADEIEHKTTLMEGKVRISAVKTEGSSQNNDIVSTLLPGQQSVISDEQEIRISTVNTKAAIAWKEGDFYFSEETLFSIVKKLERWYDVEIILNEDIKNKKLTGKISRDRNISSVLGMIEKTNQVEFKIEGRRITAISK